MKKLLSLLLIAALMLSLGVSALAYEDLIPPLWQRWGYDSLEEYLADWDETEEEYAQEVADELAWRAEQDALIATYDPAVHDFTPALWEYYGYSSKEEMLAAWEIDEAGYAEAVSDELFDYESRDWTSAQWEAYWAEEELRMLQETKKELDLIYDINVMADGAALAFPAGAPVIRNSCTMAPLSDMAAALHAAATWDGDTGAITITRGSTSMELKVDDMILSFRTEGPDDNVSGGVFYLDSLPYVENGEVYIPVRAVAEALGYEVQWSDTYRTAVLLDIGTAAAEFDAKFTVLNAILAMNEQPDKTQSYRGEGRLDLTVTVPALGETASCSGSISAVTVQNGHAAQGTVRYDMAQLLGLLVLMSSDEMPEDGELDALTEAMDDGMDMIIDLDSMTLYLRGKLLALITETEDASADVWYAMDMGELTGTMDAETLQALSEGTGSIGRLVCTFAAQTGLEPIYLKETLDEVAETLAPLADSNFTAEGNVRSLVYMPEDYDGLTITLNVTMDGDKATNLTGNLAYDADGTVIGCTFDIQPMAASVSGSIAAAGTFEIAFTLTASNAPAPDADVASAPPAGATVVDLIELLTADVYAEEAEGF